MQKQISNLDKLTLSNDFLFKHVMLRKRICKHILEELLHTEIADITYLEAEQTIDVYPDSHGIRLDVRIADAANTHYNLEMQVKNPVNRATGKFLLPKRTRLHSCHSLRRRSVCRPDQNPSDAVLPELLRLRQPCLHGYQAC